MVTKQALISMHNKVHKNTNGYLHDFLYISHHVMTYALTIWVRKSVQPLDFVIDSERLLISHHPSMGHALGCAYNKYIKTHWARQLAKLQGCHWTHRTIDHFVCTCCEFEVTSVVRICHFYIILVREG